MRIRASVLTAALFLAVFSAACADKASEPSDGDSNKAPVPAEVKAVFPEAQTINMQRKNLTSAQTADAEKEYGVKLVPKEVDTYIAYAVEGGKRFQIAAANIIDVAGTSEPIKLIAVYSNDIVFKKVVPLKGGSDAASPAFLDQFAGKDHDRKFQIGDDIVYNGADKATAEAVTSALKSDILSMQMLYGKAHTH